MQNTNDLNNQTYQMNESPYDVNHIRKDFPILNQRINGRPLIWLDNGATTQKPTIVIEAIS
jgi:cysteine desulfurase/selenocysteine lyase